MRTLREYWDDERGDAIKSISLMAFAVAMASMAGAALLDRATKDGGLWNEVSAANAARFSRSTASLPRPDGVRETNQQVTVDYTPVGAIPNNLAHPIILHPCTGARK